MLRIIVVASLLITGLGCGSSVEVHEESFVAHNDEEAEAKQRMRYWIGEAVRLLDNPKISDEHKTALRTAIADARAALTRYDEKRSRGGARAAVLGPIKISAAAITADDATGVGVGNDVLLVPLALIAMATYVITDAAANSDDLGRAWNHVLERLGELGTTTAAATMSIDDIEGECMRILTECLDNPRQPRWNREFGAKKDCRGCFAQCKRNEGKWPNAICPRIWQRDRP